MSATLSLPPGLALAQPAINGSNVSALAGAAGSLSPDAGGAGSFAALFQQLTGRQLAAEAASGQALDALGTLEGDTAVASDELTALLPFLEAMGLLPVTPTSGEATPLDVDTDIPGLAKNSSVAPLQADVVNDDAAISAARSLPGSGAQASLAALTPPLTEGKDKSALTKAANLAGQSGQSGQVGNPANDAQSRFAAALQAAGDKPAVNPPAMLLHSVGSPAPQTQNTAPTALPVAQPVGGPGWNQEVGNRIAWMATRMESRAELVLTPPQMGRVEVSLSINGDHASANFVSANPAVREALEAAMPRLREILAEAGIQLGQAQVGAENARQSAQQEKNGDNFGADRAGGTAAAGSDADGDSSMPSAALKPGRGLVDTFA
jgi:flagellar hook-length control protein FliK